MKAAGEVEGCRASASVPDHTDGVESGCQFGHEGPLPPLPLLFFFLFDDVEGVCLKVDDDKGDWEVAAASRREEEEEGEEAWRRRRLLSLLLLHRGSTEEIEVDGDDDEIDDCGFIAGASSASAGAAREGRLHLTRCVHAGNATGVTLQQRRRARRPP